MSLVANTGKLAGKTLFITGASRGIGKSIALKAAQDGANVVIAAKTAEPHPKLPGTIYTAAEEIEAAGGKALPCIVDVRDEKQIQKAVDDAVKKFNGIDILINNASAISLSATPDTDMRRYDLMHTVNTRGTFLTSKLCLPVLKNSKHGHILNMSPPINLNPYWFGVHLAYTMSKYGMSMCVLGLSEELKQFGIGVNALWPRTGIATAAVEMLTGDVSTSRKVELVSDAAYVMLCKDPKTYTGNFEIDDAVVTAAGVKDLTPYACDPSNIGNFLPDFFLDTPEAAAAYKKVMKGDASSGGIPALFDDFSKVLSPELVKKTGAVYQFNLKGAEEGVWHVDLKTGSGSCGKGEPATKADATLTLESAHFLDMFAGKLKPTAAFMGGKLKVSGDVSKAMKLEGIMKLVKK